ncbi:hypothetical protein IWQ49_000912 [Labrenzia sp. EL_126]|nr:hypothetical protein [Labrenzia sp. EL_126]
MNTETQRELTFDFITGDGRKHTLKGTGSVYQTGTFEHIVQLARSEATAPGGRPKDSHWAVFHNHDGPNARSVHTMTGEGIKASNTCTWLDIDEGDPSLKQVLEFAMAVANGHQFLVYTSKSNGEVRSEDQVNLETEWVGKKGTVKRKYRILFPHVSNIPLDTYRFFSKALCDHAEKHGLIPDRKVTTPTQLCYLPNAGQEYHFHVGEGPRMDLCGEHFRWWYHAASNLHSEHKAEQEIRGPSKDEGARSPIGAFARKHPTDALMEMYGFDSHNGEHWHHRDQTTDSYGTKLNQDGRRWVTASATVEKLVGRKSGDGFDLYTAFECDGDEVKAMAYARQCLAEEDDRHYGAATVEHGIQVYKELVAASEAREKTWEDHHKTHSLPEYDTDNDKFSRLPDPPQGPISVLAWWVYNEVMTSPNRTVAIAVAWLLAAHFAGRKDSFMGNPANVNMIMLAINGVGKDTFNKALTKIMTQLSSVVDEAKYLPETQLFERAGTSFGTTDMHEQDMGMLSAVRLLPEAGIQRKSKAGDGESVLAAELQNFAQNAYTKRIYKRSRGSNAEAYGTNVSAFRESTPETWVAGSGSMISSGETARALSVYADCSAVGETRFNLPLEVPKDVMHIIELLITEAIRGEKPPTEWYNDKSPLRQVSNLPVPNELRRHFVLAGPEEQAFVQDLAKADTEMRRKNKDNVADHDWAHKVRAPMLIFRLALLHARTRFTCGAERFTENHHVTMVDLEAADALVRESQRADLANAGNYDGPAKQLADAMRHSLVEMFKKDQPTAAYKNAFKTVTNTAELGHLFGGRKFSTRCITRNSKPYSLAKTMVDTGTVKTNAAAYTLALKEGENLNYWEADNNDNWRLL